jgi:hypothetical protein
MARKPMFEREVDECLSKIEQILKEYNCRIEFDVDLDIIIVDSDTMHFVKYVDGNK